MRASILRSSCSVSQAESSFPGQIARSSDSYLSGGQGEACGPQCRAAENGLAPIFTEFTNAGMSLRQMAVQLTAHGIPSPKGARWHAQTVARMLNRAKCAAA